MKKTLLIILAGIFIGCLFSYQAAAEEIKLSLTASASSYSRIDCTADKAVDGNDYTYWEGNRDAGEWWIMFDTGKMNQINKIIMRWYSSAGPQDYDIQVSTDGSNWENVFTGLTATYKADGELIQIAQRAKYVRLYINRIASAGYCGPMLEEFEAYTRMNLPHLLRFQANLEDAQGSSLDGRFNLIFRLYDRATGGSPLWQETQRNVAVEEGSINVELGSVTALELPFDKQYWLGVEVDSDGEMTPRFKFTSVPYAFVSEE